LLSGSSKPSTKDASSIRASSIPEPEPEPTIKIKLLLIISFISSVVNANELSSVKTPPLVIRAGESSSA
jgi:hypothetical protein